jgi:hypothetical protein
MKSKNFVDEKRWNLVRKGNIIEPKNPTRNLAPAAGPLIWIRLGW